MQPHNPRRLHQKQLPVDCTTEDDLNSWEFHYKKIKESLDGTQYQKQAIIRRRILRYFGQFKLQAQNYFSMRLNIQQQINNPFMNILTNQILLYGIDYLSIQRTQQYFTGYLLQVRRVDDSHFLLEFRNQVQCFKAFKDKIMVNVQGQSISISQIQKQTALRQQVQSKFNNPMDIFGYGDFGWVQIQSYKEFIFDRKLMARYLTNFDRIQQKSPGSRTSVYYAYSQAKRKFIKSLKQSLIKSNKNQQQNTHSFMRSRSRSKDKQKNRFHTFQEHQCQVHRPMIHQGRQSQMMAHHYGYRQCCCQCFCQHHDGRNFRNNRNSRRSVSQKQMSVQSRGSSAQDGKNFLNKNGQRLSIIEKQNVEDSDYKFELYLKNRDKKKKQATSNNEQTPKNPFFSTNKQNNNPFISSPQSQQRTQNSVIMNPKLCYPQNQVSISGIMNPRHNFGQQLGTMSSIHQPQYISNQPNNDNKNGANNDSMNFELYLQKLKLQDNSQDYSAFDIEINQ